jgi:predicted nucleic acid-binding protein
VAGEPDEQQPEEPGRRTAALTPPFLDTNVLVRYLTGDPADMAARAGRLIDSDSPFSLSGVVLAETAFVLESVYRRARAEVVDALVALVQRANVVPHGLSRATLVEALLLCRPSRRVSYADALLWAEVRDSTPPVVYSFDLNFPESGIDLRDVDA